MNQKLYVRKIVGSGKPLVLLHGMFADGSQWEKIAQLLRKDYRVIVVDLLGHGRSPRPPQATYSDHEHVAALRDTLKSVKAVKDATIVGYSMGGAVALAYSSTYPDSVQQLYLISTPFYLQPEQMLPNKYAGSILFTKISTGLFSSLERSMEKGHGVEKIVSFGNSSKKFHSMIGANDNMLEATIIRKNLNQLVSQFNFVGHLKRLKVPVTFYVGRNDNFVAGPQLEALKQYCSFIVIKRLNIIKVDHMLVQNLPKEIAKLLRTGSRDDSTKTNGQWVRIGKSLLLFSAGILLFTSLAPWVITLGLAIWVMRLGRQYIQGAFMLRNEEASYLGYFLLGIAIILLGYSLITHPDTALRISSLIIPGLILTAGLTRLIVGFMWVKKPKPLHQKLLLSGLAMVIVGSLALYGGIISTKLIVYSLGGVLVLRGIQLGVLLLHSHE